MGLHARSVAAIHAAVLPQETRAQPVVKLRLPLLAASLFLALAGCSDDEPLPGSIDDPTFETGTVRIESATGTHTVEVEIAETEEQRQRGLMQRASLAADSGMIFLFQTEQPPEGVFWMFNTLIPLSIAFIGADGTIGSIVDMAPCESPFPQWCPNYTANVPFMSALEVNQGYFVEKGIEVGDRVELTR